MARILLSAAMNRPWSPGHSLAPALGRTGHTTQVFDYRSAEDVPRELIALADSFKPDLHIVYGGEVYTPDLIRRVRAKGIYNVLWYPDVTPSLVPEAVELGKIKSNGAETLKAFDRAQKMFEKLGDSRNAGWALYLMGDHTAYSQKWAEAASYGERALPFLTKADDRQGLLQCYGFLAEMHRRTGDKEVADKYQKLAEEASRTP